MTILAACVLVAACTTETKPLKEKEYRGVVIYASDVISNGLEEWSKRIDLAGLNVIGLHANSSQEKADSLIGFLRSDLGQSFLKMCSDKGVEVEFELHILQNLLPRDLFQTHPEYFRVNEKGERTPDYNMCFTSDEAFEAMRPQLEELVSILKPTTHRYFFWPDDVVDGFCHCEECCQLSPSDQSLLFENRLLAMIREFDPEATVAHLAYYQTLDAPKTVKPADGVFLEFAPIKRDYDYPLAAEDVQKLKDNLAVFPASTAHILEYWLDESMFSHWKCDSLVPHPFKYEQCQRDIDFYRSLGINSITNFATWLYADYISQYGSTDWIFQGYGKALDAGVFEISGTRRISGLKAPWDGLEDDTVFQCNVEDGLFKFRFDVHDSTSVVIMEDAFNDEYCVASEDRVEIFFCGDKEMKHYCCAEIDPLGRVLDYEASFYRQFNNDWQFSTLQTSARMNEDGYTVSGSVSLKELGELGLDLYNGFEMGAFRADFKIDEKENWYSAVPSTDDEADFHKPEMLFTARISK